MNNWHNTPARVLILGLGISGRAAARLALNQGMTVEARDDGNQEKLRTEAQELIRPGAAIQLGEAAVKAPLSFSPDLAVISPGIPPDSELSRLAASLDCPVIDEFEFGAAYCSAPVYAVTGSNGKTTTVEMAVHCLRKAGIDAVAAGNIGRPISEISLLSPAPALVVAEVSSFQLERCRNLKTSGAAFLNLSSDHLDWHHDFTAYTQAKLKIFNTIKRADQAIVREDLANQPRAAEKLNSLPGRPLLFSTVAPASAETDFFLTERGELGRRRGDQEPEIFARTEQLGFPGKHNLENGMAAAALCELAGLDLQQTGKGLQTFTLSEHRMQTVFSQFGIRVINDSKSTNPDALCRALQSLSVEGEKNIILIAGGLNKKMDFTTVKPWLRNTVKKVICTGSCARHLANLWGDSAECEIQVNFENATVAALASVEFNDTLLLSPGCASQDAFSDYAERGRTFIELISKEMKK